MAQTQRIGKHATYIFTNSEGFTVVKYHNTDVVAFNDTTILLNTGGWFTNTTKTRMNQASNIFNLGFRVFQKDFNFYVEFKNHIQELNYNILALQR